MPLVALLAFVSAVSAWIHAAAARPHLEEYRPFGAFFILITVLQVAWAIAILVKPDRPLFVIGAIGNAGLALLWLVTRTKGLPIGPEPWTPEAVGWADLLSTLCEVIAAVGCAWLLREGRSRAPARSSDDLPQELTIREAAFLAGVPPEDIEQLISQGRLSAREVIPGMSDRSSTLVRAKQLQSVGLLEQAPAQAPAQAPTHGPIPDVDSGFVFGGRTRSVRSSGSGALVSRGLAAAAIVCIAGTALTAAGVAPSLPHEHGAPMSGAIETPPASLDGGSMRVVIGGVVWSVRFGSGRHAPVV